MITPLLVALALAPGAAEAADIPKAEYQLKLDRYDINTIDYRFPSGLRIMFQEDHTQPIVSITNWIDRGSIYDGVNEHGESTEGVAHAVEHLAFRAKHGDLPKNWDVINQLGGILNASTSREWTNYMTVAPVDAAMPLLRIEALRLSDGVRGVTAEDIEAEKSIVRNELRMGYESGANGSAAIRTAFVHVPKLLYPEGHPYRNTTIGSHETIGNITLATVERFVEENYRPEYSTIVMVGDFDVQDGAPFQMIMDAFSGVEHLLMADEDAAAYEKLETENDQIAFLNEWVPNKLVPFIEKSASEPAPPRVDCDNRGEPPPPVTPYFEQKKDDVLVIKGMVDYPTAIAAWTLPGGYCSDDVQKNMAANMLSFYIQQTVDPDYDPFKQESEVEGMGCFADVDKQSTVIMCMIEKGAISKDDPKRLLDKVGDSLYLQWQPIEPAYKPFYDRDVMRSRMFSMSDILSMTDNVASLYGRSFFVSQHAHYTGSPRFFSDTIQAYNNIQLEPVKELAKKYITRERMVGMIIEPMDEEERERLEASATEADKENNVDGQHRAKDDKSRQLFDAEALTPEAIESVVVVPDLDLVEEFDLDNGLHVVMMNHGEAPLVKVGLKVWGGDTTAPVYGLDNLAETLHSTGGVSWTNPKEDPLAIAGSVSKSDSMIYASGSSANLEALLHKARWQLEDYDWKMANKAQTVKKRKGSVKSAGKKPENWATRMRNERVFPDNPYGEWLTREEWDAVAEQADLTAMKEWVFTKWQPANAQLVIVGKIDDMDAAKEMVSSYFSSWEYQGSGTPGQVTPPAPPTSQPDRQVLLFDKPTATQSKVTLACQLKMTSEDDKARATVLGEAFSFLAFERLREEKGITYGAYGYPVIYEGNNAQFIIGSVIQNSGVGFGVQTMFDLVQEAADKELDPGFIATNKWNVARTMVSSQQSGDQMLSTLMSPGRDNLSYFERYPKVLANVDADDLSDAMSTCKGHEVVTIVGPVDKVKGQFDERKIPYEVVDWEALYEAQLDAKELKKYRKAKEKSEAEEDES